MAFTRPVIGADISAADFGQPVYDATIRAGATRTGAQGSLPNNALTSIEFTSTVADTGGFVLNTSSVVIPAGMSGVYSLTYQLEVTTASTGCILIFNIAGTRYDFVAGSGGRIAGSLTRPMAVADQAFVQIYNGFGSALVPTVSRFDFYRVGL